MNRKALGTLQIAVLLLAAFIGLICGLSIVNFNFNHVPPMQEIHVETIYNNTVWNRLLAYLERKPDIYVMLLVQHFTPDQYQIMFERYAILASKNYTFGLHVHIAISPEINTVPYESQYKAIQYGKQFLADLGIITTHYAPGYWSYNLDTVKALRECGYTHLHLWKNLYNQIEDMETVKIENYTHDWEL